MLATDWGRRFTRACGASLATALLFALHVSPADAQSATAGGSSAGTKAAAEALFIEARQRMDARDYSAACDKFAESERLDPAAGTLLNLADCYERDGKLASAWVTFREAASAAEREGRQQWGEQATARAALLEAHLPTLSVEVDPALAPEGLELLREGTPIARSTWGSPIPIDPSVQRIEARAPGMKPWGVSVRVDAENAHAVVKVPKLEPLPVPPQAPPLLPEEPRRPLQRPIALALLGVATASVGLGSVLGALAISNNSQAARRCPTSPACSDPTAVTLTNTANGEATASTVSFVAGGALLLAGGILFFTAPPKHPKTALRPPVSLGLSVGRDAWGVALAAGF
jgi:hypothetical protein